MATIAVKCRYCDSELVYKHGHARSGEPRYRCRNCQRSFQVAYRYEGHILPADKHLVTKRYTQSIERQNLNFRTRIKRLARKTLCFSKSVEIHDKVIGAFINRMFFNSSKA